MISDMEGTLSTSKSDLCGSLNTDICILAKLRRLKIQEDLLCKSIRCLMNKDDNYNHQLTLNFTKYFSMLTSSYRETTRLFDDVKSCIGNTENLLEVDISDIKKNILNLELKIKSFKNYLQGQLHSLKLEEQTLCNEKLQNDTNTETKHKLPQKGFQPIAYNKIIPSPVRAIINSPLKYSEVQDFQSFMANSRNRYGGWNEYNQNQFVSIWNKHFGKEIIADFASINKTTCFQSVLKDLKRIMPGLQESDAIDHSKWYAEYLFLKDRQKKALQKWKNNRKLMKGLRHKEDEVTMAIDNDVQDPSFCLADEFEENNAKNYTRKTHFPRSKQQHNLINIKNKQGFWKPTQQWDSRCQGIKEPHYDNFINSENKRQLGVPFWRVGLQNF